MNVDNMYADNIEQTYENQYEQKNRPDGCGDIRKNGVTYGTIRETYEWGGSRRSAYGIAAYSCAEPDGVASVILSFHDVTPYKERVDRLVWLCNHLELSPVHLDEVVEDFMAL